MVSIWNQSKRTKTYIAGDWDGDFDAVQQLMKWNSSKYWGLNDVHEATVSSDDSLNCSIKRSLCQRMSISKTFLLIVGDHTKSLRSGACYLCSKHVSFPILHCLNGYTSLDDRSYVDYECCLAKNSYDAGKIKIVVLYNSTVKHIDKCPTILQGVGTHLAMKKWVTDIYGFRKQEWNYQAIKDAIE